MLERVVVVDRRPARSTCFKHVLIRDVAYESLPRKERGRAHAETAAWIEETSGERTGELAELLAHHYDAAFSFLRDDELRRKRPRRISSTAAANAHRRFAIQQGERFARRAVELSEGRAERVEALEALGDLHYLAFLGDAAWRTYVEALEELSDRDPAFARLAGKAALFGARFVGTMHELPDGRARSRTSSSRGCVAAPMHGRERTLLLVDRGFLLVQREARRDHVARRRRAGSGSRGGGARRRRPAVGRARPRAGERDRRAAATATRTARHCGAPRSFLA